MRWIALALTVVLEFAMPSPVDARIAAIRHEQLVRQARTAMLPFTLATNPLYQPNWHHDAICWHLDKVPGGRDHAPDRYRPVFAMNFHSHGPRAQHRPAQMHDLASPSTPTP